MSNDEKILQMLTAIQSDIKTLKSDVASLKEKHAENELDKLSPEERKARLMASFEAFQKLNEEDPEGAEKFFALMDELEARRVAAC